MKKKILMMALALMGVATLSLSAQSCDQANTPQSQNKMRQPREFTEFAFEGILLDMNQQQRIDSLNAAVKANCPARPEQGCDKAAPCQSSCDSCQNTGCKKGKPACKKTQDGTKTAACDRAQGCDRAPQDCKRAPGSPMMGKCPYGDEYVAKVKEILTPEQYTLFLENIVAMPQGPQRGAQMGPKHNKMMRAREYQAPSCPQQSATQE